jgi:hypothetical protein
MERVGQTAVLGELLAGVLIGPGVLGLVHESEGLHAPGRAGRAHPAIRGGPRVRPRRVGLLRARGTLVVYSLMFALALSAAADLIGLATIIGAFAAGLILAKTDRRAHIEERVRPVPDLFVPVFFVTVACGAARAQGVPRARVDTALQTASPSSRAEVRRSLGRHRPALRVSLSAPAFPLAVGRVRTIPHRGPSWHSATVWHRRRARQCGIVPLAHARLPPFRGPGSPPDAAAHGVCTNPVETASSAICLCLRGRSWSAYGPAITEMPAQGKLFQAVV